MMNNQTIGVLFGVGMLLLIVMFIPCLSQVAEKLRILLAFFYCVCF